MKFIHTADWHLGLRLGAHDLTEIQFAQIERIVGFCQEHQAEVLVVAGDVFEKRTGLAALTKRLAAILKPQIERGLHVILVPGNHDDREHFRMMRTLLNVEDDSQKRLHIVEKQENFELCGVQWGIVPYPDRDSLAQYLQNQGDQSAGTEARNQALSTAYSQLVAGVAANFSPQKPAVLVAHITVAGVTTPSEMELSYNQDIRIGSRDLPSNVAYIALGHIHQKQQISGDNVVPTFYSGNLDRYNRGERHDPKKGVWLVEIPTAVARPHAQTTWLDLPVTPFHDITIRAEEVESLPEKYSDLDRAFVHVTLDCSQTLDPIKARRRVYELCARVLDCVTTGEGATSATTENFAPRDWRQTTLDYIVERFAGRADLPDLQLKTEDLLKEVENALTTR